MNIVYGIDPLDDIYAPEEGKPWLAGLIMGLDSSARVRRSIIVPLVSKCLENGESVVFFGLEPHFGLDGSIAELKHAIYAKERFHKTHMVEDYECFKNAPETRDADIIIAATPSYRLNFDKFDLEDFYKDMKLLSRELNKKILILADHINDVVIAKRYADIAVVLVNRVSMPEYGGEIPIDSLIYLRDQDSGKLETEEISLSYDRGLCKWCEKEHAKDQGVVTEENE